MTATAVAVKQTSEQQPELYPVTPQHSAQADKDMKRAINAVILDDPFYAAILLNRDIIEDNSVKTTKTNGKVIKYNARYVAGLTLPQIKGLLRQTAFHIASLHTVRRQNRDKTQWDYATDMVSNAIGAEAGWELPPESPIDMSYKDMSAEEAYTKVPPAPPSDGQGNGQSGGWNTSELEDTPGSENEAEAKQIEMDLIQEVSQAAQAAKNMGKLPAHIERLLDKITDAKLPWKEILAKFFKSINKDDFNWNVPNRRYLASYGIYMPSLYSHNCGPVVLAIDTSGSIGQNELAEFIAELNGIIKHAKPSKVHVVYCDAQVQRTEEYGPHDDVRATKPKGGGGTRFEPVFEWVKEQNIQPECLVYLTDMYGSFPDKEPHYPTIWVSTSEIKEAPFGKVIRM
jgi:predicted metal-dependent peptidase